MDFQLLGPFKVVSDAGEIVPIPQRLHRTVLSVLLLFAGRSCSHARLIDALWGAAGAQPKDPVKVLRIKISRIRRESGVGDRLVTVPGVYKMEPPPGELDIERFRRLNSGARRAMAAGDIDQAVNL